MKVEDTQSNAAAIIQTVKELHAPQVSQFEDARGGKAQLLVHPAGMTVTDVATYLERTWPRPRRRTGTHRTFSLAAFIDLVNRFKDAGSVIFANNDPKTPSLTAIFDFHEGGGAADPDNHARHGEHSAAYAFPLSKEWKAWHDANKKVMGQGDFAAFIEDRIADCTAPDPVLTGALNQRIAGGDFGKKTQVEELAQLLLDLNAKLATPAELVTLSRGLSVYENATVKNAINLTSGEGQVVFETQHLNEKGEALVVPGFFLIAIPVFEMGSLYQIAVRLRYRKSGGGLAWFYELYRVERVFDHAFNEACQEAIEKTEVPLYLGAVK